MCNLYRLDVPANILGDVFSAEVGDDGLDVDETIADAHEDVS